MFLVYPLKFCVTNIFDFSWDDYITQEKFETMVLGFWGCLMVYVKMVIRFRPQNNNFARASRFFVHFFATIARLWRENA